MWAIRLVAGLPLLLLSILAASIIFTWLYNSTRGSLLMVILFHALFDFLSVSRAGGDNVTAISECGGQDLGGVRDNPDKRRTSRRRKSKCLEHIL